MLAVELNRSNYEYDVNSIVRAFYPEEQVSVLTPAMGQEKRERLKGDIRIRIRLNEDSAVINMGGEEYRWEASEAAEEDAVKAPEPALREACSLHRSLLPAPQDSPVSPAVEPEGTVTDKAYKYGFKCFLYRVLSRVTGQELPWGNLTGIRPTKIAYQLLEQGKSEAEIVEHYRRKYYVSREKAELSVEISERERALLGEIRSKADMSAELGDCALGNGYSLYIGIPFCPTTCLYCSFPSFPIGGYRKLVDSYLDCLIRELEYVAQCSGGKAPDTVYIGGGTPTTLEPPQLERLLARVRELFDFSAVREFTVEAGRADSITEEKLGVLRNYEVGRISINPQTMNQVTLDYIGRKTTVEQVEQAYLSARELGFDNINMDLILGLPGEGEKEVRHTVERVTELAPDSLTVHSLAIKRASRLNQLIQETGIGMLRNTDETMRIAAEGAKRLGLVPYYLYRQKNMSGNFENVGYAKPGKLGLYNILIMEEVQTIIAVGAGSISKRVYPDGLIRRSENVKDVSQYIERIGEMIERKRALLA